MQAQASRVIKCITKGFPSTHLFLQQLLNSHPLRKVCGVSLGLLKLPLELSEGGSGDRLALRRNFCGGGGICGVVLRYLHTVLVRDLGAVACGHRSLFWILTSGGGGGDGSAVCGWGISGISLQICTGAKVLTATMRFEAVPTSPILQEKVCRCR